MDGSPAQGWEDELERWLEPFLARLQAPGAAALGAVLPQGPDPARRAQERRADGGARGARRHPAAAPLRLDLALGHRALGGRAGAGRRPAGGRARRGAGGRRHRAGEAGPALGRASSASTAASSASGPTARRWSRSPWPGPRCRSASACACSCPRTGAAMPGGARRRACPRRSPTGRSGRSRWTRSTACWPPAPASAACWPTPSTARRPSSAPASRERRLALRGGHPADPEGLPGRRDARVPGAQADRPPAQAPGALGRERGRGRAARGPAGGVPHHLLADRHQGAAQGRVRRRPGAGGRRTGRRAAGSTCPARRRGSSASTAPPASASTTWPTSRPTRRSRSWRR